MNVFAGEKTGFEAEQGGADSAGEMRAARSKQDADLWDADLNRYVLQQVVFGSRGFSLVPPLYMNTLCGQAQIRSGKLSLLADSKVGFNTYANSFFASYWEKYTELRSFSLSGRMTGQGLIHLFRSRADGKAILMGSYPVSDVFHVHFEIFGYLPSDVGAGRYFFDFEAVTDVDIEKIAFTTFQPPAKTATFSLGICTYDKAQYVTNLALCLEEYVKQGGRALSDVIIVNNDPGDDALEILHKVADRLPLLRVIEQDNIGGAGGFARSLFESQAKSSSSHHIFMDDDVFLDTRMLDRAQAFVSYCRDDHVVGGQMMDMSVPRILYEGGAKLDYWGFLHRVGDQIDGASGDELAFFDQVREVDYNAWWFACVPKSASRMVGLPLNIFIRGDDIEYGLRLKRVGIDTVSLPGLFIWHEPFEGKNAAWLEYYNWRNRLILSALHSDPEKLDIPPPDMLRDIFVDHLQAGRYDILYMMALGIMDFLAPPEAVLKVEASTWHRALRQAMAEIEEGLPAVKLRLAEDLADKNIGDDADEPGSCRFPLRQSSRLQEMRRNAKLIPWLDKTIAGPLETILAFYAAHSEAAKLRWRESAAETTNPEAWAQLYDWSDGA